MSDTDKAGEPRRQAILLTKRQQWASGLVGGSAAGGGAVATFITSNQAGATALMLGGALGLLMSLTGRVPDRIGKEGVVHEPVDQVPGKALDRALNDPELPQQDKLKLAKIVQEVRQDVGDEPTWTSRITRLPEMPPVIGEAVRAASDALIYQDRVKEILRTAQPQGWRIVDEDRALDRGLDFIIEPDVDHPAPERSIAIEVKTRVLTSAEIWSLYNNLGSNFGAVLLVVPRGRWPGGTGFRDDHPSNIRMVEFGAFGDNGSFGVERRDRSELQHAVTEVWSKLNPAADVVTPEPEVVPWEPGPDAEGRLGSDT
jgi:hypothetical protein